MSMSQGGQVWGSARAKQVTGKRGIMEKKNGTIVNSIINKIYLKINEGTTSRNNPALNLLCLQKVLPLLGDSLLVSL